MGFLNSVRRFKLKKILSFLAAALLAAAFMGCSNDSDDNNSALLLSLSSGGSSLSSALPASVGTNELAGKTFKSDDDSESSLFSVKTIEFSDSFYVEKYGINYCQKYAYTYNSDTKSLYSCFLDYYSEGNVDSSNATTSTDDELEKQVRYFLYHSYGYTDTTGETDVPAEVIARYERDMSLMYKGIKRQAYNLASDGTTLKLVLDSRYPKDTTMDNIYTTDYANDSLLIVSNFYKLSYGRQYVWPERNAALMSYDSKIGYKVSSVKDGVINYTAKGTRASEDNDFIYDTALAGSFSYSVLSETSERVIYILRYSDGTEFGSITIDYATSSNVPDMTSASTYTLVTE